MTPEYIEELADMADPQSLWKRSGLDQLKLAPHLKHQLDTGVALRRHAEDVRRLRAMLATGESLLITPLSPMGRATKVVPTPDDHKRLRDKWPRP